MDAANCRFQGLRGKRGIKWRFPFRDEEPVHAVHRLVILGRDKQSSNLRQRMPGWRRTCDPGAGRRSTIEMEVCGCVCDDVNSASLETSGTAIEHDTIEVRRDDWKSWMERGYITFMRGKRQIKTLSCEGSTGRTGCGNGKLVDAFALARRHSGPVQCDWRYQRTVEAAWGTKKAKRKLNEV